jgi:hypothetical protein
MIDDGRCIGPRRHPSGKLLARTARAHTVEVTIAVFHLEAEHRPAVRLYGEHDLLAALAEAERLRKAGMHHVCISTDLGDSVGAPGVSDRLPEGYDWSKQQRGAGPSPRDDS